MVLLVMPILFVFYTENNISMTQIFILQANCSLWSVLLEIPSGYFSDRLGRRNTLILAAFFSLAGFAIYALPVVKFWTLLIAETMMGVGMSFVSGTDDALFYDSLIELKEEGRYKKLNAVYQSIGNFSEAGAAIAGSLLATVFLRLPFIIEAVLVGMLVPLSIALKSRRSSIRNTRPSR
jgi:MFS family permease